MKLAFLILIHRYPEQAKKLIRLLLKEPDTTIFIHVDTKAQAVFEELQHEFENEKRVVFIKKRYRVYWGSYNQIRATLGLLKLAHAQGPFDHYSLLSGQDLPIKPLAEFKKFLAQNPNKEFMMVFKLPNPENWGGNGGLDRLQLFWINALIPRYSYTFNRITALMHRIQKRIGYKRQLRFEPYGGSNWFTLSREGADLVVKFLKENRWYLRCFKHSRCADEIVVQSILMNSRLKDNMVNNDLRFIDWGTGPEYPRTLRSEDKVRFNQDSSKFFGRKFDEKVDAKIIDTLYREL